jgi:hypothetical protein
VSDLINNARGANDATVLVRYVFMDGYTTGTGHWRALRSVPVRAHRALLRQNIVLSVNISPPLPSRPPGVLRRVYILDYTLLIQ